MRKLTTLAVLLFAVALQGCSLVNRPPEARQGEVALQAVVADGAKPIPENVEFTLIKVDGSGHRKVAALAKGGVVRVAVDPGDYALQTTFAQTTKEEKIVVEPAGTSHTVVLNAGEITLGVVTGSNRSKVQRQIHWTIRQFGTKASSKPYYETVAAQPYVVLPAGWYKVQAAFDGAVLNHVVEVEVGHHYNYFIAMR